jgi:hypothetical protein
MLPAALFRRHGFIRFRHCFAATLSRAAAIRAGCRRLACFSPPLFFDTLPLIFSPFLISFRQAEIRHYFIFDEPHIIITEIAEAIIAADAVSPLLRCRFRRRHFDAAAAISFIRQPPLAAFDRSRHAITPR